MVTVEYLYSAHSAFAYLGAAQVEAICARHGARLVHRPILLAPVVEAQGGRPFRARTQAHVDYFFGREIERWAEWRGVDIIGHRPTHHDADYRLASGMILALGESGPSVDRMAHRLLEAHWREDADLSDEATLAAIATDLGHEAGALLGQAASAGIQGRLAANTARAVERGVFGSPTYLVDGDPFYGQDRLDLVERALHRPFRAPAWRNPAVE